MFIKVSYGRLGLSKLKSVRRNYKGKGQYI